jgi:RNA polymerase sigma factor (sigma-70 family)
MTTDVVEPSARVVEADDSAAPDRDLVGTYLHEISRTPLLSAAQEVELAKQVEAGLLAEFWLDDGTFPEHVTRTELTRLAAEGRRAKDAFILANLRLVVSIARRYTRSAMPLLDLVQEGNSGLVRAVEKFDYQRGYKFSTYATWWIRQAISRAIAQQARTVRLPVHLVEEINRMRNVRRDLTRELGRDPEIVELAGALDIEPLRVEELIRWARETVSLDTPVGEDGETSLSDLVADGDEPSPEDVVIAALQRDGLGQMIERLDPRSARIVRARYGLEDGRQQSLTEIAGTLGLSRERVRQLENAALHQLRELAASEGVVAA